ncbi:MAG: hypothetical protein KGL56_12375 [Alphaproteobacteria bacterium]|nr:hypothetical protein [Alphaproteobacteria bacterium]
MTKKKSIRAIPQEPAPTQKPPPDERKSGFSEVACGYTPEQFLREAERCLMCPEQRYCRFNSVRTRWA